MITCSQSRSKDSKGFFIYEKENSLLQHGGIDEDNNITNFCTSVGQLSTVSLQININFII